jgi:hypothetical protein
MNRFPGMMHNVNESLDEIINAMNKMNIICQSAEQMSPIVQQFAKLMGEARASVSGPVRVSGDGTKTGRPLATGGRKKRPVPNRRSARDW